jgi:predicted HD phosphohydrolase
MDKAASKHATFSDMAQSTAEDWAIIIKEHSPFASNGGRRILEHLRLLDGDYGGFPIDRLTHCLQTATRAYRDGRAVDYVVMALLHDIGDTLIIRTLQPQLLNLLYLHSCTGLCNITVFFRARISSIILG